MRRTLDRLISTLGLLLALLLAIAAGLLFYANSFVSRNVSDQLSQQNITMPAAAQLTTPSMKEHLSQYAGQKMTTGDQAKAYAEYYIAEHMKAMSGGKTYSEVSADYMKLSKDPSADPKQVQQLGELRQTLFMGDTLRGLLLNAYAFGTMAKVALWAGIASAIGSLLSLLLSLLGFRHAGRATDDVVTTSRTVPAANGAHTA